MRPLRIGVNALYLIPGGVGGTEIYLRNLLAAMADAGSAHDYFVFTNRETAAQPLPVAANLHMLEQPVRAAARPARILWEQAALPLAAARLKLDVLLNPGFTAPVICPCPQVTVFHDLQHKRYPEYFRWFDLPFWRMLLYCSARRSRLLIAVSDATAADLFRFYKTPREKVRVVPHGVEREFFDIAHRRKPEPFVLSVSTLHPHKNLDNLLRAFAAFRRTRPEYRLVLAGMHGFFTRQVMQTVRDLHLEGVVAIPGWIPREKLLDLFARASAFVYPSRFEGFGMPVLEALAAGVPSACSQIEPLAQLAGGAALLFDPDDPDAIRQCLERLIGDECLKARLAVEGPVRAARYTWHNTAIETLNILQSAVTL